MLSCFFFCEYAHKINRQRFSHHMLLFLAPIRLLNFAKKNLGRSPATRKKVLEQKWEKKEISQLKKLMI